MKKTIPTILTSLCFLLLASVPSFSAVSLKVRPGDNLYTIAKKHHVSVEKLKSVNGLKTHNLKLGQKLVIQKDRKDSLRKFAKNSRHTPAPMIAEETENDGEFLEYRTIRGDTVEKVAVKFGVEKDDILESNSSLGKKLSPGRVLLIPRVPDTDKDKDDDYVELSNKIVKSWKNHEERYMLVKVAKSFMGAPYRYGGESVRGLDCSAFVKKIYDIFDVQLPRSARDQFRAGPKVQKEELTVGDLVFFRTKRYAKYPTHVGIYIGDGNFIHSSSGHCKIGVKIDSLQSDFYSKTFLGGTRVKKSPDENPEITKNPTDVPSNYRS
jgi:peptidoglycan DL-endopeptidase LytE